MTIEETTIGEKIVEGPGAYLGAQVTVIAIMKRFRVRHEKTWKKIEIEPRRGMVIGVRRLRNGTVHFYSDHIEWYPTGDPIPCILVVFGPHENPVRVPIDSIDLFPVAPE